MTEVLIAVFGGFFGAFFQSWWSSGEQRRARHADFLQRQLQSVYGPVHNLCLLAQDVSKHVAAINDAYTAKYVDIQYSEMHGGHERIEKEAEQTIKFADAYATELIEIHRKIRELISASWDLVDIDDMPMFRSITMNALRYDKEFGESAIEVPHRIRRELPMVVYYDSRVWDAVDKRFKQKSADLAATRRLPFSCIDWMQKETAKLERPADSESAGPS